MTKHNGKARKAGVAVGQVLVNRNKKGGPISTSAMFRHTTDITNGQSVLERGDLEELMAMADLADRDFTAERTQVVVISTGAVDPLAEERNAQERREAEDRHRHRLRLPRRPAWTPDMSPEELDLQERNAFLAWRRELAQLEEEEKLVLTPFEKNLEVWRQLWRVLERSDVVVQVVDARSPLLYRSTDLEAYAREILATKSSFILLNKADLLPDHVRAAWADFFDKIGLPYAFFSAFLVAQEQQLLRQEAAELGVDVFDLRALRRQQQQQQQQQRQQQAGSRGDKQEDPRIRLLEGEELMELMEEEARKAVAAAGPDDPRANDPSRRLVVGLVGYPNVGKSSTINALFGSKKTAVAPTPGKTKHFQTLNVSPSLCLCDCPGLVMPVFANSKPEMVAAGVIPIDRLTDIRGPVEVVAKRIGRWQVENCYGFKLPRPQPHEPPSTPPTAMQLLRSLAVLRGWTAGSGLPDETRAGRQILRDYTNGKLVYCLMPPGSTEESWVPGPGDVPRGGAGQQGTGLAAAVAAGQQGQGDSEEEEDSEKEEWEEGEEEEEGDGAAAGAGAGASGAGAGPSEADVMLLQQGEGAAARTKYALPRVGPAVADRPLGPAAAAAAAAAAAGPSGRRAAAAAAAAAAAGKGNLGGLPLDEADLDMLRGLEDSKGKARRPDYKFNKKAARSKGDRGQQRGEGGFDGGAMATGKKGGLVRVAGQP